MIKPELYDVVELIYPAEDGMLPPGTEGTIVMEHGENMFEVEFVNEAGETLALCMLTRDQFLVVWQAVTQLPVPLAEQVAQLVELLPQAARAEVLDFARFLSVRQGQRVAA
ncbi:MAG: DUF2281 domain-containing protein [Anaerolineae bacterium]|nr:DUF2281 domain-containing protein [Anaerolineae bacterium]